MIHIIKATLIIFVILANTQSNAQTSFASNEAQHNQDHWMVSASLNKLITAWLAWHTLGPNHTFITSLKYCGNQHYHMRMTYDPTFSKQKLSHVLSKIRHKSGITLGIQPVPLTEPANPSWMIEDGASNYNYALSPWSPHDKSGALTIQDIQKLNHSVSNIRIENEPSTCRLVTFHRSLPVKQLLFKGLIESHNPTLDALWLASADHIEPNASTTWESAAKTITAWINKHHPGYLSGMKIYDGSGLSRKNMITASGMLNFLNLIGGEKVYFRWLQANLPHASQTGTLRERFKLLSHYPIVAKTGGMSGISNLAGWIITPHEKKAFVWLETNPIQMTDDKTILSYIHRAVEPDIEA